MRSAATVAENARPGNPSWRITHAASRGFVEGFADRTFAAEGQSVVLRVSTTAPRLQVTAYRIGWYGGAGARAVWSSMTVPGHRQPACVLRRHVHMVSCQGWRPTLTVPVTSAFVPGDYLFKLVGSGGQQSFVPLTVWDPSSHATYLVKNDVFTWQAWNAYGGYEVASAGGTFHSDMTYYTDPRSRAGVWDSGTNNWITALEPGPAVPARAAHAVQRITGNVLALLGRGPAGLPRPSRPNR